MTRRGEGDVLLGEVDGGGGLGILLWLAGREEYVLVLAPGAARLRSEDGSDVASGVVGCG
jgi:hypothetical protein